MEINRVTLGLGESIANGVPFRQGAGAFALNGYDGYVVNIGYCVGSAAVRQIFLQMNVIVPISEGLQDRDDNFGAQIFFGWSRSDFDQATVGSLAKNLSRGDVAIDQQSMRIHVKGPSRILPRPDRAEACPFPVLTHKICDSFGRRPHFDYESL
ncbi:MAG TPA: hypothetical protein VG820_09100 [Fimbriimonadaceae bacterium]|nr:hypothetical protein [Fimbriimonadaceae bacterium]